MHSPKLNMASPFNRAAQALGRLARGHKKRLSARERARRTLWAREMTRRRLAAFAAAVKK
jgi:hypothetical protein